MSQGTTIRFTYQDYLQLPDESRYEILDGDLQMSPSPTERHQQAVGNLYEVFARFVRERRLGRVLIAPFDGILSETVVVQPDVLFVSRDRAAIVRENGVFGAPDLVIEVMSPATAQRDRTVKAKLYARAGVKELWLVDPDGRTIEVLSNGPDGFQRVSFSRADEAASSPILPGLRVVVNEGL